MPDDPRVIRVPADPDYVLGDRRPMRPLRRRVQTDDGPTRYEVVGWLDADAADDLIGKLEDR